MNFKSLMAYLLTVLLSAGALIASGQKTIKITGQIGKHWQGKVLLNYQFKGLSRLDSAKMVNGKFYFKIPRDRDPVLGLIKIDGVGGHSVDTIPPEQRGLYLEDVPISITGNEGLFSAVIKGGPAEDDYLLLDKAYLPIFKLNQEVIIKYAKAQKDSDKVAIAEVNSDYAMMQKKSFQIDSAFRADHHDSFPAFAMWVFGLPKMISPEIEKEFNSYPDKIRNTDMGKRLNERIAQARVLWIGQPAPEIVLSDSTGQVQKLSALKNKYVLVYFYNYSQQSTDLYGINIGRTARRLADKNVVIFGVYYDSDVNNSELPRFWKSVVAKYRWPGIQVSDIGGGAGADDGYYSETAKAWGLDKIHTLPIAYLVGPDGKIAGYNLNLGDPNLSVKITNLIK